MKQTDPLFVAVGVGVAALILITLSQYIFFLAIGTMLIGVGVGGMRLYMVWELHRVEVETRRYKGVVIPPSQVKPVKQPQPIALPSPKSSGQPAVMTFKDLMTKKLIGPNKDYLFGHTAEGTPLSMPLITSLGIGGFPGSGKTVTTLVVLLETLIKYEGRVRFLIVDPHMYVSGDESLSAKIGALFPYFLSLDEILDTVPDQDDEYLDLLDAMPTLTNPVEGGEELAQWMKIVRMEMERRSKGKTGDLWVVVVDEFVEVMSSREGKVVGEVVEKLNQQARKMSMFSVLVSQEWKVDRIGNTALRDSIPSFIVHNMPESVAKLIAPSDVARQATRLDVGEVVLYNRGKTERGRVAFADDRDSERVLDMLGGA